MLPSGGVRPFLFGWLLIFSCRSCCSHGSSCASQASASVTSEHHQTTLRKTERNTHRNYCLNSLLNLPLFRSRFWSFLVVSAEFRFQNWPARKQRTTRHLEFPALPPRTRRPRLRISQAAPYPRSLADLGISLLRAGGRF